MVGPDVTWTTPRSESDWKYIDTDQPVDKPRWSADGRLIYFLSARGGLWNVWAVAFDPATGPKGPPMPVTRFDGPGEQIPSQIGPLEISVARGRLVIPARSSDRRHLDAEVQSLMWAGFVFVAFHG